MESLNEEENTKRLKAGNLSRLLTCDLVIRFSLSEKPKKAKKTWNGTVKKIVERGLEDKAAITFEAWSESKVEVGVRYMEEASVKNLLVMENPAAVDIVILGPLFAEDTKQKAKEFREFWGKERCELRKFADGAIMESIKITAMHGTAGKFYIVPSIVRHLMSVHFSDLIQCEFMTLGNNIDPQYFIAQNMRQVRSHLEALSKIIRSSSDPGLPIRKIQGLCSCVRMGGESVDQHYVVSAKGSKLVTTEEGKCFPKKEVTIAIPKTTAVPVLIDITTKKKMDAGMFARLRMAYLLNLKENLEEKNELKCVIKDLKLFVQFQSTLFSIDVESPVVSDAQPETYNSISSFIYRVSLTHRAFAPTGHIFKKWLAAKFLELLPEVFVDLLVANVFLTPVQHLGPPQTVELALLRLFDFLSFHDFSRMPLIVADEDTMDKKIIHMNKKAFTDERDKFPAICIFTMFDTSPSNFSRQISKQEAVRLVNFARQTLHNLITSPSVEWNKVIDQVLEPSSTANFDIVISLKPLQVPKIKPQKEQTSQGEAIFPVVDFDPVVLYLLELRDTYGDVATFYLSRRECAIGVKLDMELIRSKQDQAEANVVRASLGKFIVNRKLVPNIEAMVDDIRILGTGLVKSVEVKL